MRFDSARTVEWRTLSAALACYALWGFGTSYLASLSLPLAVVFTGVVIAFHSSLQHEIIHGHPFQNRFLNQALVFPSLNVFIPFIRFRDTHLGHHQDALLTDPYDDPESNYLDPDVWEKLPIPVRLILQLNNTLAGRIFIGPIVGQVYFMRGDLREIRVGHQHVRTAWLWHIPAVALVLIWLALVGSMPVWAYLIAAYIGLAILKIRTFLEHQAEEHASHRTVVIEDRGLLALLFLNNNLHIVHHMHPGVAWYKLPALYFDNNARYLQRNGGYVYRSYAEIFRLHFWHVKDDVAHPFWRRR